MAVGARRRRPAGLTRAAPGTPATSGARRCGSSTRAVAASIAWMREDWTSSSRSSTRWPAAAASSGRPAAGQVVGQLGAVEGQVAGEVRVLEGRGPARVAGRARPVAQRRPALRLQHLQFGLSEEGHPLGVGLRRAPLERPVRPRQRLLAARSGRRAPPSRPPPAARAATAAAASPAGRAARCPACAARTASRGRPASRARNDVLQKACASSAGSPGHPRGRQRLRVVRAGVVEAPRVVRQPPHRDGQFTRPRVQPVGGGPAGGGPRVEQRVRGPQRLPRPAGRGRRPPCRSSSSRICRTASSTAVTSASPTRRWTGSGRGGDGRGRGRGPGRRPPSWWCRSS